MIHLAGLPNSSEISSRNRAIFDGERLVYHRGIPWTVAITAVFSETPRDIVLWGWTTVRSDVSVKLNHSDPALSCSPPVCSPSFLRPWEAAKPHSNSDGCERLSMQARYPCLWNRWYLGDLVESLCNIS